MHTTMVEEISEQQFLARLPAFGDGELDSRERLEVLHYIAAHPEAIQCLIAQEQFRDEIRRALGRLTPPLPESLNRRLMEIAANPSGTPKP